jgi:hypothetical protein
MGQKYLASGVHIAMRLWEDEPPGVPEPAAQREYETVGYVIKGRAGDRGADGAARARRLMGRAQRGAASL